MEKKDVVVHLHQHDYTAPSIVVLIIASVYLSSIQYHIPAFTPKSIIPMNVDSVINTSSVEMPRYFPINDVHESLKYHVQQYNIVCMHHLKHEHQENLKFCVLKGGYTMINLRVVETMGSLSLFKEHSIACNGFLKRWRAECVHAQWIDSNNYLMHSKICGKGAAAVQLAVEEMEDKISCGDEPQTALKNVG